MQQFDVVQAWIDNVAYCHSKSEETASEYRRQLSAFCDFIGKTPQQILDDYEGMRDRDFRRKYAQYVRALISKRLREGYAPCSIRNQATVVKSFFKYNDLPLGHVPLARSRIVYHNRDIAKEEVQAILGASRPRDKAFYTIIGQSGLRPDILCNLRLKHVEPEFSKGVVPCKTEVPEELAKGEFGAFFTFMGEESVRYLKAYLATRPGIGPEDYLFAAHGTHKRSNPKSISTIFSRTIKRLKQKGIMDFAEAPRGKPAEVRLYNLRKFFRNHARQAGVEYVNFWMGHKANYKAPHIPESDEHYFSREDVEFHRKLYAEKAMPFLRLETATPSETEQQITELRRLLEEERHKKTAMEKELEELRKMSCATHETNRAIIETLRKHGLVVTVKRDKE